MKSNSVIGADEFLRDLQKLGNEMGRVKREMLKAGGDEMAEAWKREIGRRNFVESGAMKNGVRCQVKTMKSRKGELKAEVTSHGTDGHGVSNSAKAFYLHYGTSRGIKPSHWIDAAEAEGYPLADAAMRARLDQAINNTIGGKGK